MSTYVYQRYAAYNNTTNSTTPTTRNAYVTYDSTYKVMNLTIADGAGGDCAQGLGLEYLSDTYSWGNVLSDYMMVFPYNGTFTASYWNGTDWVVWDTHTITTGSITNPPRVFREGTTGPGVEGTTGSGGATNMASGATLWKWEGTAPFYLGINDNADDEFSVLGWNSSTQNTPRSGNTITDISGRGNNGTLLNGPVYVKDNRGALSFDGVDDYVSASNFNGMLGGNNPFSISFWFYTSTSASSNPEVPFFYGNEATGQAIRIRLSSNGSITSGHWGGAGYDWSVSSAFSANTWTYVSETYNGTTDIMYINGISIGSSNINSLSIPTSGILLLGKRTTGEIYGGNIAQVSIYNRALTAQEIQQNYIATKSRFGL